VITILHDTPCNELSNYCVLFCIVCIYENHAYFNITTLTFFQESTQAFLLNQPQVVCQRSLLSNLACVWLAAKAARHWLAWAVLQQKLAV